MARINVEESLYKDIRFHDLIQKMGGTDAALGSVVRAWSVAQDYWLLNHVGIPLPVWKSQRLRPELIEVDLAEIRGDFVYIRGSEEQFAWLDACSENGKKSHHKIIEEKGARPIPTAEHGQATDKHRKPLTLPLSPSLPLSQKKEEKEEKDFSVLKSEIQEAIGIWGRTLARFKIAKPPNLDEQDIARLLQRHGVQKTQLALLGCGFEEKTESFDPAKHVSIRRLHKPDLFEKFVNLGAIEAGKRNPTKCDAKPSATEPIPDDGIEMTPEARDMLKGMGILRPKGAA